jgi:SAM-dependent methyltransferase
MATSEQQTDVSISMPVDGDGRDQDAEWCWVSAGDDSRRRIRFHDYAEIYAIPGLYERLFHDELQCASPSTVRRLLSEVLEQRGRDASELRVLDLGAGSGMVGEELRDIGASHLVGLDICEVARVAAERDRPSVYDEYLVADMTAPEPSADRALRDARLNCLISVAALGFGDIPPKAFANAFNYIATGGLIVFTLRDRFLERGDKTGYRALINRILDASVARPIIRTRYRHRLSASGKPLYYVAVVAEKTADVPDAWS